MPIQARGRRRDGGDPAARNRSGSPRKYADLAIDGQVRLEVRTDRIRNERCSSDPAPRPQLRLPRQLQARPGWTTRSTSGPTGLLGQRVHVNVDFDTERDFTANNNVQVYYEGLRGRDRPAGRGRHRDLPAAAVPLHHRRHPGQQLRRQRQVRGRAAPAPDPGRHPEGQPGRRADLHRRARPRARPRTARSATSISRAAASSGSWTRRQPARATRRSTS